MISHEQGAWLRQVAWTSLGAMDTVRSAVAHLLVDGELSEEQRKAFEALADSADHYFAAVQATVQALAPWKATVVPSGQFGPNVVGASPPVSPPPVLEEDEGGDHPADHVVNPS